MVSAAPVGAEGQPAGGGADHARRQDRWRSHPVGRDEGGVRAQRRGSAETGEAVARQPLPPAEETDGPQRDASDHQAVVAFVVAFTRDQ